MKKYPWELFYYILIFELLLVSIAGANAFFKIKEKPQKEIAVFVEDNAEAVEDNIEEILKINILDEQPILFKESEEEKEKNEYDNDPMRELERIVEEEITELVMKFNLK